MAELREVPSWAMAMVRNWRYQANIPNTISDWEIYRIIEDEQLSILENTEEEKNEILRECLGLE